MVHWTPHSDVLLQSCAVQQHCCWGGVCHTLWQCVCRRYVAWWHEVWSCLCQLQGSSKHCCSASAGLQNPQFDTIRVWAGCFVGGGRVVKEHVGLLLQTKASESLQFAVGKTSIDFPGSLCCRGICVVVRAQHPAQLLMLIIAELVPPVCTREGRINDNRSGTLSAQDNTAPVLPLEMHLADSAAVLVLRICITDCWFTSRV